MPLTELNADRVGVRVAGERLSQELAVSVTVGMAVIKIDRPAALWSWVYAEFERSLRSFISTLDQRL